MNVSTEISSKIKHLSQKFAIVGPSGAKKLVLNIFNATINGKMKAFDTMEKALEYLVQ